MNERYSKSYADATNKLLKQLNGLGLSFGERLQARNLTLLFRDSFKLEPVKQAVFEPELGPNGYNVFTYDADGFCQASSCAFAAMMNKTGQPKTWQLMYISELWVYGPHCYLMHLPTHSVFDLTADQYTVHNIEVPYDIGRPIPIDSFGATMATRLINAAVSTAKTKD